MFEKLKNRIITLKGKKPELQDFKDDNSVAYLSAEYLRDGKLTQFAKIDSVSDKYFCTENDLLIIWDGSNSGEVFMGKEGILSSTMAKIEVNDNLYLKKYLYYFLKNNFEILNEKVTGAAIPHLNRSTLENLEIYKASLAEQKEIVDVLDAADRIISLRTACIESAQDLIPALFQEMFGDPLSKVDKNKIGYYFDVGTGATPRRENSEYYEGNIPWVKTTEVDNCYINSTSEHISESAIKETNCSLYPPGTILMAMYGQGKTRGKVAYLNISATTNQACAALQLKKEYENDVNLIYVFYYLQIIYEFLRTLSQGGGRPNMNLSIVRNIPLYLPDIKQQELFAKKVQEIEAYIKTQQAELENAKTMFQSLLHHSFTGELTRRAYGE